MFQTNSNRDRLDYGKVLIPPDGYVLEKAVGTTYSLDLEAMTAISIVLGLQEETDSQVLHNPISMLNSLQKVSGKLLIFCEAGQIKHSTHPSTLMLLLEKMVIQVALSKKKGMLGFPAFHPKTWLMQYRNPDGKRLYRFAVLSRNLTFDRSWDICFCMNGTETGQQAEKTEPLAHFLEFLTDQISSDIRNARQKRLFLRTLMSEVRTVSFSTDSKEFGDDFDILPLGIGANAWDMKKDPLFCTNRGKPPYCFHDLVVFSPFLSGSIIEEWNRQEHNRYHQGKSDTKRTLITRRSELEKLTKDQVSNFKIYVLKNDVVDGEELISDAGDNKQRQDIHAKIYLKRIYAHTDLYLGSMNATSAAVGANVEMMIRLGCQSRYLYGDSILKELFCGPADAPTNPFEEVEVRQATATEQVDETKEMEQFVKAFCRKRQKAEVTANGERYDVTVICELPELGNLKAEIAPLRRSVYQELSGKTEFRGMELLQLSEFYQIRVSNGENSIERIVMISTVGIPDGRENAIVGSIVKDRESFVEYVAFVLGDSYLMSALEAQLQGESGEQSTEVQRMPALYEKMLRTASDEPEKLKEIEYLLKMVQDRKVIPDEFRELYETFRTTLRLR